jgi:hypothetical protein
MDGGDFKEETPADSLTCYGWLQTFTNILYVEEDGSTGANMFGLG